MSVLMTGMGSVPKMYDENTLLLLHGDSLLDNSMYGRTVNNNGVSISNTQSKFGEKSLYFNNKSYMTIDVPVDGDMTFECWLYIVDFSSSYPTPIDHLSGSYRGYYAHIMSDGISFGYTSSGGSVGSFSGSVLNIGTWHHIAMTRSNGTFRAYVNGALVGLQSAVYRSNDTLWLGTLKELPEHCYFHGYMNEIRISNVVRWESNFVPPTKPYRG